MPWTPAQTEAIGADNSSVLISAAAGSGKTAVLVERVIRLLREGCDIDRMLIVTFTRAAAAEMRERIEAALSREGNSPALRRQAARVGRAHISTLHSFCQRFLKDHFSRAGIDPAFRLSSESELLPLWEEALSEALAEMWTDPGPDSAALRDQFDYEELEDLVPALRQALLSRAKPFAWARERAAAGSALMMAELDGCVFGAYDPRQGCCGSVYTLPQDPAFFHRVSCVGGVLEEQCGALLRRFFVERRSSPSV